MKKNWLSWLLWIPPFGLLGMHKLYLNNPLMALVYFFTGGGCLFGWIMDAFSMNKQVREANKKTIHQVKEHIKTKLLEDSSQSLIEGRVIDAIVNETVLDPASGTAENHPAARGSAADGVEQRLPGRTGGRDVEKQILKLAFEQSGKVTIGDVAVHTDLSLSEAEAVLKDMSTKGYCGMNVTENGKIEYEFEGIFTDT